MGGGGARACRPTVPQRCKTYPGRSLALVAPPGCRFVSAARVHDADLRTSAVCSGSARRASEAVFVTTSKQAGDLVRGTVRGTAGAVAHARSSPQLVWWDARPNCNPCAGSGAHDRAGCCAGLHRGEMVIRPADHGWLAHPGICVRTCGVPLHPSGGCMGTSLASVPRKNGGYHAHRGPGSRLFSCDEHAGRSWRR